MRDRETYCWCRSAELLQLRRLERIHAGQAQMRQAWHSIEQESDGFDTEVSAVR